MRSVSTPARGAIFLDKDGTLLVDVPYNVDPWRMRLAPMAGAGLRRLARLDAPLLVISNQPGVALGYFAMEDLVGVRRRMQELFERYGAVLKDFYVCPHHPEAVVPSLRCHCLCRKPMPGLLTRAATVHGLDLSRSWFVGDILDDVEAGHRAGCRTILIDNGNETEWRRDTNDPRRRTPDYVVSNFDEAAQLITHSWHDPDRWLSRGPTSIGDRSGH